jgi:hypothetical protein
MEMMYQEIWPKVQEYISEHPIIPYDYWDRLSLRYNYSVIIEYPLALKSMCLKYVNKEVDSFALRKERTLNHKAVPEKITIGAYEAKNNKDTRVSLYFDEKEMLDSFSDLHKGGPICLHIDLKQDGSPKLKLYNTQRTIDLKQVKIYGKNR